MRIIVGDPAAKSTDQGEGAGPLLQPEAFLVARTHHPLGIGMTLGVVVAGQGLLAPQETASFHEGPRGRLPPMVTHQGHVLAPSAMRKLALHRHVQSRQPLPSGAGCTSVVPHDLLGIPLEHKHARSPAETLHQHLGHVDAPPLVRLGRPRFAAGWRPFGVPSYLRSDQQLLCAHQAQHPLLGDRALLDITHVGPEPAVPPTRVRGVKRSEAWPQLVVMLHDRERPLAPQPHSSSLVGSSRGSSPTSFFRRAFS
jgi:hypothetical protein